MAPISRFNLNAQQRSRLCLLPAELREMIFKFSLAADRPALPSGGFLADVWESLTAGSRSAPPTPAGLALSREMESDVDLLNPDPPTKSLLLTCKTFYHEARPLYQQAYREYWSTTKFVVNCSTSISQLRKALYGTTTNGLSSQHLRAISSLKLRRSPFYYELELDPCGAWLGEYSGFWRSHVFVTGRYLSACTHGRLIDIATKDGSTREQLIIVLAPDERRETAELAKVLAGRTHLTRTELMSMALFCRADMREFDLW